MFRRCGIWQGKSRPGCYPDCDMLPVGTIGGCFGDRKERMTALTREELKTMLTLWCIFGSPLMIGGEMTKMDSFTLDLLTNREVLDMLRAGSNAAELVRTEDQAIWASTDPEGGKGYIALFNLADEERAVHCWIGVAADRGLKAWDGGVLKELWTGQEAAVITGGLSCLVPAHGVKVFRY